jgi:hypothetical protein
MIFRINPKYENDMPSKNIEKITKNNFLNTKIPD